MIALKQVLAAFSLLIFAGAAQALPFNFEYEFNQGGVLSGMFDGEIQADGDTIVVSRIFSVAFSELPGLDFRTELLRNRNIASLSGVDVDLSTSTPTRQLGAFAFS